VPFTPECTIGYWAVNREHYVVVSTSPSCLDRTWHIRDSCVLVVLKGILVVAGCRLEQLCRRRLVRSSDGTELCRNHGQPHTTGRLLLPALGAGGFHAVSTIDN
jgi:hypothetical protein